MTVEELTQQHVRAMDLSGQADVLKRNGRADDAKAMLAEAFEIEKAVAMAVERYPSRSILLKSAAVLASECGKFDEAYRLCGLILSEERTPLVRSEVLELLQDIRFETTHLELHLTRANAHQEARRAMSNDRYWEIDGIGGVSVYASSSSIRGDRVRLVLHMAGASRLFKDSKAVAAHLRKIAAQCISIADEIEA